MPPILRSTATLRLDLTKDQLLYLCIFYIYLSPSAAIVAALLNKCFNLKRLLTAENVQNTYLHLHDTEHAIWRRAKDINREEKELLKCTLRSFGMERRLLDVDIIKPVAPMACLRVSRQKARGESCTNV